MTDRHSFVGSEEVKAARAAENKRISAAAWALAGWQPIETAPRDGSDVLVYDGGVHVASWYVTSPTICGWWAVDHGVETSHWMPLPPPP